MSVNDASCWQPASQAVSEQTARYYQARTWGQIVAFRHSNGNWYLHAPTPPAMLPAGEVPQRRAVPPRQGVTS